MKKLLLKLIITIPLIISPLGIYFILDATIDNDWITTIGYPILLVIQIALCLIGAFLIGDWIHRVRSKDDQLTW